MKNNIFHLQMLTFATIVLAIFPVAAHALSAADNDVTVSVSLDTPNSITLGEPIILHYKVFNNSPDHKLGVLLGVYGNSWYTLTLTDPVGEPITEIPDPRPSEPKGLFIPGDVYLTTEGSSQDQRENYDVVNQLFSPLHPGQYILTAHVHLPYAVASLSEIGLSDKLVKSSGAMLVHDFVFPIRIAPSNPIRLTQISEYLCQKITSENNDAKRKAMLSALFAMPAAQAFTSWNLLASQADWKDQESIAEQLAKVHSVKTTDLLLKMLDRSVPNTDEEAFIRTKIDESYNSGDATVKDHIKTTANSRGIQMPDKVAIPEVGD